MKSRVTILKWFTTMPMAVKALCAGTEGRCLTKFAESVGIQKELYKFIATDGEHEARIDTNGIVYLKMNDVDVIVNHHSDFLVDTGSPHYVKLIPHLAEYDVVKKGREIRYSREFEKEGINVNFVEQLDEPDKIFVRTYERGVENETLSCGTGVTASALVCYHNENGFNEVEVKTLGGRLNVEFDRIDDGKFRNIWLCGPAKEYLTEVLRSKPSRLHYNFSRCIVLIYVFMAFL
jgi:diaminopimelate epimerase